ncbi:MAG: dihydrofolate reductase [Cocleimonas sp.]|jgi:dihydrofolate reductase
MKLAMIVAMAKNNVIGLNNDMPWHLPADLQWFKKTTLGSPIIMGRKTYESIGRPLPGRLNIILSRDTELEIDGCTVVNTLKDAIKIAEEANNASDKTRDEVFITGGAHLYNKFLADADTLYITQIDAELEGDTFFPDYTKYNWQEKQRIEHAADEQNSYPLTFLQLERLRSESCEPELAK